MSTDYMVRVKKIRSEAVGSDRKKNVPFLKCKDTNEH